MNYADRIINGETINDILKSGDISEKQLLHELTSDVINIRITNELLNFYKKFTIKSDYCLVMSDIHLGNKNYDNYLHLVAFNYARNHNIKDVVIVGDWIQGSTNKDDINLDANTQIDSLCSHIDAYKDINIYYLFGNHETNMTETYIQILEKEISQFPNLIRLGNEDGAIYLNDDTPIGLNHHIPHKKSYYMKSPYLPTYFSIEGHHHTWWWRDYEYNIIGINDKIFKSEIVSLPPMFRIKGYVEPQEGFLILGNKGDNFVFQRVTIDNKYKEIHSVPEVVQKKRLF